MNLRRFIKAVAQIGVSNIIALFGNVILSLLIPKILGMEDYGLYKIFTLYISYIALLHLGFVDGIALKYGGKDYDTLDKEELRSYLTIFSGVEILISIIIIAIGLLFIERKYWFILLCVVANIIIVNITSYYQLLSQAVKRFRELATRNVVNAIMQCLYIAILFLIYKFVDETYANYRVCILLNLFTKAVLLMWYIYSYREISKPSFLHLNKYKKGFVEILKVGMPITWAAMISNLILILDRQFVSVLFSSTEYAVYAFAYTIFGLLISMISAVSTVLYPLIKENKNVEIVCSFFPRFTAAIQVFVGGALVFFVPMCSFIGCFLPSYTSSIDIMKIIFPGVMMSSVVTVITLTFYKYFNLGRVFFRFSIITLAVAFLTNLIGYLLFKSTEAIAIASIITLIIQYIITNGYLAKQIKETWLPNFVYVIGIITSFYLTSFLLDNSLSWIAYIACFLAITTIIYGQDIRSIIVKYLYKRT